ncbi:MAG: hypothetical protein HY904_07840 [Deltaproteobacteria bacterium]|nr:hypothetical protein [Deltaproteobacteria bacterium]
MTGYQALTLPLPQKKFRPSNHSGGATGPPGEITMATTIQQRASALANKTHIKGRDAAGLVSMAEKDEKITRVEARAMDKVGRLKNDRFEKSGAEVHSSVDELRGSAEWSRELLDCKLDVKSSVPGLTVAFDKHVTVETGEYGNTYCRFLNLQMKGKTAGKDGSLAFEYGGFKVTVPVKKGMTAERIFNSVERRVLSQQNGAMTVRGGFDSARVLNPSVGFGVHRTAPMTPVERLQYDKRMLEADLIEMNMEGAPDALTRPILDEIRKLEARIAKLEQG